MRRHDLILVCVAFFLLIFLIPTSGRVPITDQSYPDLMYTFPNGTSIVSNGTPVIQSLVIIKPDRASTASGTLNLTGWWYGHNIMDWLHEDSDELDQWGYYDNCKQNTEHNIVDHTTYYEGINPSKDWKVYANQDGNTLFGLSADTRLEGTISGDYVVFTVTLFRGDRWEDPPCIYNYGDEIEDLEGAVSKQGELYFIEGAVAGHRDFYKECHIRDIDYCEDYYKTTNLTWAATHTTRVSPTVVSYLDAEDLDRYVIGATADGESKVIIQIDLPPEVTSISQVSISFQPDAGKLLDDAKIFANRFRQTWQAPKDFGGTEQNPAMGRREITPSIYLAGNTVSAPHFYLYKPPVLLLHGLFSDEKTWGTMKKHLTTNYLGGNKYLAEAISYDNDVHFSDNIGAVGDAVRQTIYSARECAGEMKCGVANIVVKKTDVIGHSMGGILANLYVNSPYYDHEQDANRIVTIGTPHSGSEFANFALHFLFNESPSDAWTCFMTGIFKLGKKSIAAGAVEDLQVGSEALSSYRENMHERVPVYAIRGVRTNPTLAIALTYDFFWNWDHYLDTSNTFFPDADASNWYDLFDVSKVEEGLFGSTFSSDCVVSLESQKGGITKTTTLPVADHIEETTNNGVIEFAENVLRSPVGSLEQGGFSPSADYPKARVGPYHIISECPPIFESYSRASALSGSIVVTSPANGAVFRPGVNMTINVSYMGLPYHGVYLFTENQHFLFDNATPYRFLVPIEKEFIGPLRIVAWVENADGSVDNASIVVYVNSTSAPSSIDVYPSTLFIESGKNISLHTEGFYGAENITRDITSHAVGTAYSSSNTSVATVSQDGIVTALAVGDAAITILNGASTQLDVHVIPSCDTLVDGMVVRKKIKFCPGAYNLANGIAIDIDSVEIDCNGAVIIGNATGDGLRLVGRRGLTIKNCVIKNFANGIILNNSLNTVLISNRLESNDYALYILQSNKTSVFNSNISFNRYHGIFAEYSYVMNISSNNLISNGMSGDFGYGIYPRYGSTAWIANNIISNNSGASYAYGIKFRQFSNIYIINNTISKNKDYAVYSEFSDGAFVRDNNLTFNTGGVYLNSSTNQKIYHNNFINNTKQAYDNLANYWNDSKGGNYWSNYDSAAEGCVDGNNDKICDSPYVIDADSKDNYPFTKEGGWIILLRGDANGDCVVNIFDLAKVGICFGCKCGDACWNNCTDADTKQDCAIDIFDLATVGLNFGRRC